MNKRVIVIETPDYIKEAEQKAKKIDLAMGIHKNYVKPKGGFSRYQNKNLKTAGKSGRMKTFKFNTKLKSWNLYLTKKISFQELRELQAIGK